MLRKLLTLSCLCLLLLTLSGCVNGHFHLTVHSDGSGVYELKVETNPLLLSQFAQLRKRLEQYGYRLTEIKQGDKVGWIARKEVNNLKAHPPGPEFKTISPIALLKVDAPQFTQQQGLWFHQMQLHTKVDMNGLNLPMLNDGADLRFILTLPIEPQTHNATTVSADGKTLTWQIVPGEVTPIDLNVRYPNFIAWGVTLLILVILAGAAWWAVKKKSGRQGPPSDSFHQS
ncbi:DUF3153 domain-containing protein [Laceyella tengchongensis]